VQAPLAKPIEALPATTPAAQREAATLEGAAPTTGTVVVHARYADDRTPAAGMMMLLWPAGANPRFDARRLRADATGTARYEDVPPGRFIVSNHSSGKGCDVTAGETAEVELDLGPGLTVTGIVVTRERVPVAGAQVELTDGGIRFPEVVAVTGADGRFLARCCPDLMNVGARAPGHSASAAHFLRGKEGNTADVELVLGSDGGMLDGTVVDARGNPVAEAIVIVGTEAAGGVRDHMPAFPAVVRSDEAGHFRAVGISAGEQPIGVRAVGFAPWQGRCDIVAGATATQRIELAAGGTVRGTVTNTDGKPVARATVEINDHWDLQRFQTQSTADGAFELTGLPLGEIRLRCKHDDHGKAEALVQTTAADTVVCDLKLSRGIVLRGHVVDSDGQPVPGVDLWCDGEGAAREWGGFPQTDAKGQFAVTNCPEQGTIRIRCYATGFAELEQRGIDPRSADVTLRLQRAVARTVRILGTLVGPDGRPVANAQVEGVNRDASASTGLEPTDNAGRFTLGPLSPDMWRVRVTSSDHPEFTSEERQLGTNATWDLGTITLARGGRARVRLVGPPRDGAAFCVVDAASRRRFWGVSHAAAGDRRTSVLAEGDYLLLVMGKGVAQQALPFTIRAGEDVVVDVDLQQGIAQRIVCDVPAGTAVDDAVLVWIQRGGAPVARAAHSYRYDEPADVWLAPGDYTAIAELGALRGSTTFTVGTVSGEVRVTLR
jgi:protocatechuate 3,4-dioxygenase beta subunit